MSETITPASIDSARARATKAHELVLDGAKLANKYSECRWGELEGCTVIVSAVTGATYVIDRATGSFFRTHPNPGSRTLTGVSPTNVVKEDREWLFPLMSGSIPGGKSVLERYREGKIPPPPIEAPKVQSAGPAPFQVPGIKVARVERRVVLVEEQEHVDLAPHQVQALLKAAGVIVPDNAAITLTETGYVRVSWTKGTREEIE